MGSNGARNSHAGRRFTTSVTLRTVIKSESGPPVPACLPLADSQHANVACHREVQASVQFTHQSLPYTETYERQQKNHNTRAALTPLAVRAGRACDKSTLLG